MTNETKRFASILFLIISFIGLSLLVSMLGYPKWGAAFAGGAWSGALYMSVNYLRESIK